MTGQSKEEEVIEPEPVEENREQYEEPLTSESKYSDYQSTNYQSGETQDLDDALKRIKYKRDENYAINKRKHNVYRKLLSDKKGIKNAIVLSEI